MKIFVLPLLMSLALSACAGPVTMGPQISQQALSAETKKQNEMVYQRYIDDQNRIKRISFPILQFNSAFCGDAVTPMTGITAWSIESIAREYRTTAQSLYNIDNRLSIQYVAPRSPASKAGLAPGDVITAINGQPLPTEGTQGLKMAAKLMKDAGMNPSELAITRGKQNFVKTIQPVEGCDYPVVLDFSNSELNAYADGQRIIITKGMMRFTENDNELALVLSHELGHSAMDHISKLKQNAMAGSLGGLLIDSLFAAGGVSTGGQFSQLGGQMGVAQHSVGFEQEADYVGMYFMERAGYSSAGVANFWRRMATEGQSSVNQRTSHPTSPERFLAIEQTHKEIADKRAKNLALVPNMQKQ